MANNLRPGQFQIGNLIFGRNTMFPMTSKGEYGYDVNAQDYQLDQNNEIRFGLDSKKPANMTFQMGYLINEALPNVQAITGNLDMDFSNDPQLENLVSEWSAAEVSERWGEHKPIYYCRRNGETVAIFGRPGRLSYRIPSMKSNFITITAEYRRADPNVYSEAEYYRVISTPATPVDVTRNAGMANAFVRFFLQGPMTHPVVNFGDHQFEMNYQIASDEIVEISSYPWSRRIVNDENLGVGGYYISESGYLEKLKFNAGETRTISWVADDTTSNSTLIFMFRDAWAALD